MTMLGYPSNSLASMLPADGRALRCACNAQHADPQITVHASALQHETSMNHEQARGERDYSASCFYCNPCPTTDI